MTAPCSRTSWNTWPILTQRSAPPGRGCGPGGALVVFVPNAGERGGPAVSRTLARMGAGTTPVALHRATLTRVLADAGYADIDVRRVAGGATRRRCRSASAPRLDPQTAGRSAPPRRSSVDACARTGGRARGVERTRTTTRRDRAPSRLKAMFRRRGAEPPGARPSASASRRPRRVPPRARPTTGGDRLCRLTDASRVDEHAPAGLADQRAMGVAGHDAVGLKRRRQFDQALVRCGLVHQHLGRDRRVCHASRAPRTSRAARGASAAGRRGRRGSCRTGDGRSTNATRSRRRRM